MALLAQTIALVESGALLRLEPCRVDLAFATGLFAPRWWPWGHVSRFARGPFERHCPFGDEPESIAPCSCCFGVGLCICCTPCALFASGSLQLGLRRSLHLLGGTLSSRTSLSWLYWCDAPAFRSHFVEERSNLRELFQSSELLVRFVPLSWGSSLPTGWAAWDSLALVRVLHLIIFPRGRRGFPGLVT